MSRKIKFWILPLFLIIASCSQDESEVLIDEQNSDPTTTSSITQEILQLVNQHRESVGKSILNRNSIADNIAKEHTDYYDFQK